MAPLPDDGRELVPDGREVFHWPETQALFARMGYKPKYTIDIKIVIPCGGRPYIEESYAVRQPKKDVVDLIETTTMSNEKYRTFAPPVEVLPNE